MYQNRIGAYRQSDVMTADPTTLVVMCYNAAISQLKMAKTKLMEKEYEEKGKALKKTLDILRELISALNFEKGGEIAKNLNAIYAYVYRRISQADIEKKPEAFDEVIGIFEELRDAWKKISEPTRVEPRDNQSLSQRAALA